MGKRPAPRGWAAPPRMAEAAKPEGRAPPPAPAFAARLALGLAITAGFADAFGYLRLKGLLTSHVTGNLAFMAVGIARGDPHILMKFLAVPIFVLWVGLASLAIGGRGRAPQAALARGLALEILFLCLASAALLAMPPARGPDDLSAVILGTLMLGAMGTQNALMRVALPSLPSTTAMTTNISEATVRWVSGFLLPAAERAPAAAQARALGMRRAAITVGAFAGGAVLGAAAALTLGGFGLAPPILLLALLRALVSLPGPGQASAA